MNIERVSGTHKECGEQIGQKFGEQIYKAVIETRNFPAPGLDWEGTLTKAKLYWEKTVEAYPEIAQEIEGVALGANVNTLELFTYMTEELWGAPEQDTKACSDIVLAPPLTDGRIIVGHNNDLTPAFKDKVFPIEWDFDDGTSMFTVGPLGFYISCGINSYGLAITGNELSPTDNKIGIPRSIICRAILTAKNIDEAIIIATDPRRASSYNNLISSKNRVLNIEGSGTAYEITEPKNGSLAHTNHYVCQSMLKFEGKPNYESSIKRLASAQEQFAERSGRQLTELDMETMLKDHSGGEGDNNTLCRHGEKSPSLFGIIIDFGDKCVKLAMGQPCKTIFEKVWDIPGK